MKLMLPMVVVILTSTQSMSAQGWRGIVPLRSTRTDVERLLGQPNGHCRCIYETDGEEIRVEYSEAPCVGWPSGWKVASDTVLALHIQWRQARDLSDLGIVESDFQKAADDTLNTYYSSRVKGVQYTVSWDHKVRGISYIPSAGNSNLRCRCSPPHDESVARSTIFDEFALRSIEDTLARLDNYAIQLQNFEKWKGYVIAYAGNRTTQEKARRYRQVMLKHLTETRGLPRERVAIIDGGYMKEPYVELFLLTKELSPPEARGTREPCFK